MQDDFDLDCNDRAESIMKDKKRGKESDLRILPQNMSAAIIRIP